ncbi:hypothetical protein J6590_088908 [Homalodisca vitripennis]|nr:hypothetical protein J6590_088908 [Homalodisca vitripennis]
MRDDIEFNIKFCEEVEQYPCLYDNSRSDYCNRSAQDQAWQKIAQTLDNQKSRQHKKKKNKTVKTNSWMTVLLRNVMPLKILLKMPTFPLLVILQKQVDLLLFRLL